MYFFEKLFQTIFIFIVFLDLDWYLLVPTLACCLVSHHFLLNYISGDFPVASGDHNWHEWFDIPLGNQFVDLRIFCFSGVFKLIYNCLFFDDNRFLNENFVIQKILFIILSDDSNLLLRATVVYVLLRDLLLKFSL